MSSANAQWLGLSAHTSTPSDAIGRLEARAELRVGSPGGSAGAAVLELSYSLRANLPRLRIPTEVPAGRADGLWKHTCFEAFLAPGVSREYYELNFSPAKQWAAYHFDAYREGMKPVALPPPQISVRHSMHALELDAVVHFPAMAAPMIQRPRLALSAVLEEDNGRLCYWAARHAPGPPDFHHPDGFVLEL